MATTKPHRKTTLEPAAPAPATGSHSVHANASPAKSRPEAPTKLRKAGTETGQAGWPEPSQPRGRFRSELG